MRVAHFSDLHLLRLAGASPLEFVSGKVIAGSLNLLFNRARRYRVDRAAALIDDVAAGGYDHVV